MVHLRPRFLILATLCALAASPSFVSEAEAYVLATRPSRAMLADDAHHSSTSTAAFASRSAFVARAPQDGNGDAADSSSTSMPVLHAPKGKSKGGKKKEEEDVQNKKHGKKGKGNAHRKGKKERKGRKGSRVGFSLCSVEEDQLLSDSTLGSGL